MIRRIWLGGIGAAFAAIAFAAAAAPAEPEGASGAIPDLLGPWQNANNFKLIAVPASPKPIDDLAGYPHHERGVDANGKDYSTNAYVGDYTSPLLTPWASAILKKEAELSIKGTDPFWAATLCYPFGPTALLQPEPVAFVQTPDKVTIIYQRDHQVRHVYLNVAHSKSPKPSWYGESVGHYEGDTLVVDTIGFNGKSYVDRYGTPYSEQLHLIERYRMSPDGKNMQAEVTYDDPKAFTAQWKSLIKYRRGRDLPVEVACAESAVDSFTGKLNPIPVAEKSDF
jgi:hypothetical protein